MNGWRGPLALSLLCALSASACTVGSGSGEAAGPIYIANCGGYAGSRTDPIVFDLNPKFFAAQGVEDVREGEKTNRLAIRIQRRGGNLEASDVLHFNIVNSGEVARCMRGRKFLTSQGKLVPDYDANVCDWATPEGPPRIRVGPNDYVRAALTPFSTCRSDNQPLNVVGTAIACLGEKTNVPCPEQDPAKWPSWIQFQTFGSVDPGIGPPDQRRAIDGNFKVEFQERILASAFHLTLQDAQLIVPLVTPSPVPPRIEGTMDGWFDFDFDRGRAVQTFP